MTRPLPRAALLGIPWDGGSSYERGSALAPPVIREAFRAEASNRWTESGVDLSAPGRVADEGDLRLDPADPRPEIESAAAGLLARGDRPLFLGGDHSITYPLVRAVARAHPGLGILHLDAHPDLYDVFQDDRHSHACPFARIMEEGLATRLVQVGIRAATGEQRDQAERFGVETIPMTDWRDDLAPRFDGPVYVSFDLDALDPAHAPGVSHREPGGLSTRQAIGLLQRLEGRVVAADLVELNPRRDVGGLAAAACGKLVKELLALLLKE